MNIVVLEYEEKIQRGAAQMGQLQEQLARQANSTDANIDAYRRVSNIKSTQNTLMVLQMHVIYNTYKCI